MRHFLMYKTSYLIAKTVYTCNHTMFIGTPYCIYRQRMDNCPELLSQKTEVQLIRACEKDAEKGVENKAQKFKCGRCEWAQLSQSDESAEEQDS